MRAAIYIRVSTKMQEDRYSLAAQRTELTTYAKNQGWTIVGEFRDVDSGGKLDKQGLNALLDLVEEGRIDVVLCIDQDRLSRLDTIAWEYLKSALRDNHVKIAEPGNIVDLDNEDDEFISDIKNLIARREKKAIVRRMMRGKRQRMREGKGWGKPPFEYYYDKKDQAYKLDENWSWVIPFIDDLYLNKQYGLHTIANELNKISKTPTGNLWNEHLLHTRMTTKAYHGVMEKTYANGETISIEDIYPIIRTKETWEKIQLEKSKRGEQFKTTSRQRDQLHLLRRTHIVCGECGRKILLAQHGNKDKPRYYLKHGRRLSLKDGGIVCDMAINTVRIENNLINAIKDILSGEELAKKYMDLDYDYQEQDFLKKQIAKNEKTIQSLEAKLDKLIDLFLDSPMSKDRLAKKQTEIENELRVVTKQNNQLKAKYEVIQNNALSYEFIYELLEVAEGFDTELTPVERAQVMGNLFPKGVLNRDHLLLLTEFKGVPLEVKIPIDDDPYTWHFTKQHN